MGKFARFLFSTILLIFAIPAIFTIPAQAILFRPQPYEQAVRAENIYEQIPTWLAELLPGSGMLASPQGVQGDAFQYLNQQEYERILRLLMPADWIVAQGDALIEQAWAFLNFRTTQLSLTIDLTQLKARLAGPEGDNIAGDILQTWPPCSLDLAQSLAQQLFSGGLGGIPACRPPEILLPVFTSAMQAGIRTFAANLPDQISVSRLLDILGGNNPAIQSARRAFYNTYRAFRIVLGVAPIVALLMILGIAVVSISRPRLIPGTIGRPLWLAALAALVITVLLFLSGNAIATLIVGNLIAPQPQGLYQALVEVVQIVGNRFLIFSALAAVLVAAVGFVLEMVGQGSEEV